MGRFPELTPVRRQANRGWLPTPGAGDSNSSAVSGVPMHAGAETTDGNTVTNNGTSSVVSSVPMDMGKGINNSASVAEQDSSDDKGPSNSIPGESAHYCGLQARLTTTLQ